MMEIINVHQASIQLSHLLDRVSHGEEIVLAKKGKPYARLVPIKALSPRKPGIVPGKLDHSFFDPLPEDELQAWRQ
jgi:prevent-host-death family protein